MHRSYISRNLFLYQPFYVMTKYTEFRSDYSFEKQYSGRVLKHLVMLLGAPVLRFL